MLCCQSKRIKILCLLGAILLAYRTYNLVFRVKKQEVSSQLHKKKGVQTFSQLKEACLKLPAYHTISKKPGGRLQYANTAITADEFKTIINQYIHFEGERLNSNECWFARKVPYLSRMNFFVQKLLLASDAKIAVHADIHADIHALIAYLDDVTKKGYIQKGSFKINDPNFYMVFLGNYTGQGCYGAEVLYTILRLKLENPDQVIILKGTYESFESNSSYGFSDELKNKFGFKPKEIKELSKLYSYFPDAVYVGCGETKLKDYVLFCHGGLEPGFDPKPLLTDQRNKIYQPIDKLTISWLTPTVKNRLKKAAGVSYMPDWLYAKFVTDTGFKWSDFLVDDGKTYLEYNPESSINLGKNATQDLLQEYSAKTDHVRAIVRGHQHYEKMFEKILQNHGIYNSWSNCQWSGKEGEKLNIAKGGPVWTLNVSPGSFYVTKKFNYDTYAILTISTKFADWIIEPHKVNVFG